VTEQHPTSPLEARLERLEQELARTRREARGWRRVGAAGLGLAAVLLFTGQAAPDEQVTAKRFVLADGAGNTRAALQLVAGEPHLTLYDFAAKARLDLSTSDQGATRVALQDAGGQGRLALAITPEGLPTLSLADEQGKARQVLTLQGGKEAALLLQDEKGTPLASLGAAKGLPTLALRDKKNVIRVLLALEEKFGSLRFYDEKGEKTEVVEGD
jgi:hypothetical protein